jgi:hypothetical protein
MALFSYKLSWQPLLARKYLTRGGVLAGLLLGTSSGFSFQNSAQIDSLKTLLLTATNTNRVNLLNSLGKQFWRSHADTARGYAWEALDLSKKIRYPKGKAEAIRIIGWSYRTQVNFVQAGAYLRQAI